MNECTCVKWCSCSWLLVKWCLCSWLRYETCCGLACSNEAFREAVASREDDDARLLQDKMKRSLDADERSHLGVSQLRRFLEHLLQRRYLESVPTILPLLESEHRSTDQRLKKVRDELHDLNTSNLKVRACETASR